MTFQISKPSNAKTIVPSGTHLAYCYGIVDMWSQETTYKKVLSIKKQLNFMFEFPHALISVDGVEIPMTKQKTFTNSFTDSSNLVKVIRLRVPGVNEDFDLASLIGKAVMITIIHDENENGKYAAISSIVAAPLSLEIPGYKTKNEHICLNLLDKETIAKEMGKLANYKRLSETVMGSPEYQSLFAVTDIFHDNEVSEKVSKDLKGTSTKYERVLE